MKVVIYCWDVFSCHIFSSHWYFFAPVVVVVVFLYYGSLVFMDYELVVLQTQQGE